MGISERTGEQLAILREQVRRARPAAPEGLATSEPVARVVVDVPLPHLDRLFDYAVPASMARSAAPGVRVRVRFAGRLVDGWVVQRCAASESDRPLTRLTRVSSPDPALTAEVLALSRAVADRYAGTLADVLRAAVPPRHAAAEAALLAEPAGAQDILAAAGDGQWAAYAKGPAMLARLRAGGAPRTAWTARPGEDWPGALAHVAGVVAAAGRGVVVVAPDARDVRLLADALTVALGPGRHVVLSAELPPAARYRAFLAVRHGRVRVVVGTRAAAFAPMADAGLLMLWDDGDDSLVDPRAPYWHAREVLSIRAQQADCALLVGSWSRSVDVGRAVRTGWLTSLTATRAAVRASAPLVRAVGGEVAGEVELARDPAARTARLPHTAFEVARAALADGPVLVQVARAGYLPALACAACRHPARCRACAGPLAMASDRHASCAWCGRPAPDWRCPHCGHGRFRAGGTGVGRTAEELGKAFRGVRVVTSGRDAGGRGVRDTVPPRPALVVATPGAEPRVDGGYAAALLLDGRLLLDRADLRAAEEAARRWFAAAALVRPASAGGTVVLVADADLAAVQALVRWDPAGFADRELTERVAAGLPPAARVAELVGAPTDVDALLALTRLPPAARVLGPVPWELRRTPRRSGSTAAGSTPSGAVAPPLARALVTVPPAQGAALARELRAAAGVRSARKDGGQVTVRIDPVPLA